MPVAQTVEHQIRRSLINDELEIIWKEAVIACFKVLSSIWQEGLKRTAKNLNQKSWYPSQDLKLEVADIQTTHPVQRSYERYHLS
jgi:hypothetical protein